MNLAVLKSTVAAYVHRDDRGTMDNLLNAVQFAQNWIQQQFAPQESNKLGSLTFAAASAGPWAEAPLPTGFGRFVVIQVAGSPALDYLDPRSFLERVAGPGIGNGFTIAGAAVLADASLVGVSALTNYILQPTTLANDSDANYLTTAYADALVWAAVAEQHRFVQDWDQADLAEGRAVALIKQYDNAHAAKQQSGGRLILRS
jgi:hypothetical protein